MMKRLFLLAVLLYVFFMLLTASSTNAQSTGAVPTPFIDNRACWSWDDFVFLRILTPGSVIAEYPDVMDPTTLSLQPYQFGFVDVGRREGAIFAPSSDPFCFILVQTTLGFPNEQWIHPAATCAITAQTGMRNLANFAEKKWPGINGQELIDIKSYGQVLVMTLRGYIPPPGRNMVDNRWSFSIDGDGCLTPKEYSNTLP